MLKEFDDFVEFCLEHGRTLENHKAFGEMARSLREEIKQLEVIQSTVDSATVCPNYQGVGDEECFTCAHSPVNAELPNDFTRWI